jgi:hypothetical protein
MYIVSFHEQTIRFDLHKKVGNKFEHYTTNYDVNKNITGMMPSSAQGSVLVYGYHARSKQRDISSNTWFDDYFAVTEISDKTCEHLLAEWGNAHPLFMNKILFVAKSQIEAVAEAKSMLAGGLAQINTGCRPMSINDHLEKNVAESQKHIARPSYF